MLLHSKGNYLQNKKSSTKWKKIFANDMSRHLGVWSQVGITTNKASRGDGIPVELFQILKNDAVKVLHSTFQQIWKTQQWPQVWERSVLIPVPKKGNAKECSNYHTIVLISHASKVMLKILQARLQQCMNRELPGVQAGFRKGRGTRDQIANIHWLCQSLWLWITTNWKILKEMGKPDHLTCFLRNLYEVKKQQLELDMEQWTGSK